MAYDNHTNLAYSAVATAPSPATSGTTLVVQTGDGSIFPTPPFNATVWPAGASPLVGTAEIVRVTGKSTDTFTITRTQEGTSARSIIVGDQIAATITAKTITDIETGGMVQLFDLTLGSPATTIDTGASGVPGGHSSLMIIVLARAANAVFSGNFGLQFNADTGANYDYIWTNNSAGVSTSFATTGQTSAKAMEGPGASIGAGIFGVAHITIPGYTQTTADKAMTSLGGFAETSGHSELVHLVSTWRSTAAITQITLVSGIGNLVTGSRMTIWGLP